MESAAVKCASTTAVSAGLSHSRPQQHPRYYRSRDQNGLQATHEVYYLIAREVSDVVPDRDYGTMSLKFNFYSPVTVLSAWRLVTDEVEELLAKGLEIIAIAGIRASWRQPGAKSHPS